MPMREMALPSGVTNVAAVKRTLNYPLQAAEATFLRAGEGGSDVIVPLCAGDEFVGEILEGQHMKGWDANIAVFTAIISSGNLKFEGLAAVAGTGGAGWVNNRHPVIHCHATELTVAMESATNDTGGVASRDIRFSFMLTKGKVETDPLSDADYLRWYFDVDEDGLICYVVKEIDGTPSTLFSGSTYDDASARSDSADIVWIWRIVFHDGHAGEAAPEDDKHMHVYVKTAATLVLAEAATENELTTSPYDVSDLTFNVSYPAFRVYTEDDTNYYDTGDEAIAHYFRAVHPGMDIRYNITEANRDLGDVTLWDGDPDGSGVQVFDEDHEFAGDVYLKNNFLELWVDEGAQYGLKLSYWDGAAWSHAVDRLYPVQTTDSKNLTYPYFQRIVKFTKDSTIIRVKLCDDAVDDDDYYATVDITLERGRRAIKLDFIEVYPIQHVRFWFEDSTTIRFGYVGDDEMSDDDVSVNANNTTMSDNVLIAFDESLVFLAGLFTDQKPAAGNAMFQAADGGDLGLVDIDATELFTTTVWAFLIPYALASDLFKCATTWTKEGGAGTQSGVGETCASMVLLTGGVGEGAYWDLVAGTDILRGRYMLVVRDRGSPEHDYQFRVYNNTDGEYRNQEGEWVVFTALNVTFSNHFMVFDVTEADVDGGDTIRIRALDDIEAGTVAIDYGVIFPIGNGEDFPQDLSHAAMRDFSQPYRVLER